MKSVIFRTDLEEVEKMFEDETKAMSDKPVKEIHIQQHLIGKEISGVGSNMQEDKYMIFLEGGEEVWFVSDIYQDKPYITMELRKHKPNVQT